MKHGCWLAVALLLSPVAQAQQNHIVQQAQLAGITKAEPRAKVRNVILSAPAGIAREVHAAARDFASFRDPAWSALTFMQIGAASADLATSLDNLHSCPTCVETGVSRLFVGQHPDAHKYIIGGIFEIGMEAVATHYLRNHGPKQNFYWKLLWVLPQSFSLCDHAYAAGHNASLVLR